MMSILAINGGEPVRTKPYPKWPVARANELEHLMKVLESSDWGVLNSEVDKLAEAFRDFTGAKYALPVSNGTISLEIILRALNIGRGDEVIIPIYTFVASVSAIAMVGATPVFADVEYSSHLLDYKSVERSITSKTKAIMVVHVGGRPCDMDSILQLANKYNIPVIEDAAQAHGAQWKDKKAGTMGIAGSFSSQASKNIPAGEGGIITTDDEVLYRKMWSIRDYGRDHNSGIWYSHKELGTNAGIGAWQAAILLEQLKDAEQLLEKRMDSCRYLTEQLCHLLFLEFLSEDERVSKNACHLLMLKYKKEHLENIPRKRFLDALRAEGITIFGDGYSQPINTMGIMQSEAFFRATGTERRYDEIDTPVAEKIALEEGIWMLQPAMLEEKEDLDLIVQAMEKIMANAKELK